MMLKNLEWKQDGSGNWKATSAIHDDGDFFCWEVLQPRGARVWFQLSGSPELVGEAASTKFDTLAQAEAEAQSVEDRMINALALDSDDPDDLSPMGGGECE